MVHRIDDPTAAATLPVPRAAGTPGYFTAGNPGAGVLATVVRYEFMNMLQEELINVVTVAGITPSKTDNTQLLQALSLVLDSAPIFVNSSTSLTVPAWARHIAVRLVGGGGGGGHCQANAGNFTSGAGGGSGAYVEAVRAVTPGTTITMTIGAGGLAEAAGGNTIVQSPTWQLTAGGGRGAFWNTPQSCSGGDGGSVPDPGDLNSNGNGGGDGQAGGGVTATGNGGPGPWGGGVRAGQGPGTDGRGPGAGGAGAYDNGNTNVFMAGGKGANGIITYRWQP